MNDTTFYIATAASLAVIFIAYRAIRGPKDMMAAPRPDSDFGKFGTGIRLRDLYRMAVMMEDEGIALYLRLAETAQDLNTRKLCVKLADEETLHKQLFSDRLARWRDLPPNRVTWPKFLEQVKLEGLFANPPGGAATEKELAAFAIAQERHSVQFYGMFEKGFPDAWRREKLKDLVEQERSHEAKLREAYPDIP